MLNKKKIVFGLCGYAGVGKDTIYKELIKLAPSMLIERVAFADPLKKDTMGCEKALEQMGFTPATDPDYKEKFRDLWVEWSRVAKKFDPMFWIKRAEPTVREWGRREDHKVCITDVRYDFEVKFIQKNFKGLVIYIERPGYYARNEEEEESFEAIKANYPDLIENRIINDGSKEKLALNVMKRIIDAFEIAELPRFSCSICGTNIFQKKITCNVCKASVCKKCVIYNAPKMAFRCINCK